MGRILAKSLIRLYQLFLSPLLHWLAGPGFGCRYTPSCSEYAREAIELHGGFKGSVLAIKRIGRCHPFSKYGYDPVPEKKKKDQSQWIVEH